METGAKVALGLSGLAIVGVAVVAYRQMSPAIPANLGGKLEMLKDDVARHENGISAISQTIESRLAALDRKLDREIDGALQRLQQLAAQFEVLSEKKGAA